jgi:hypothetical protein
MDAARSPLAAWESFYVIIGSSAAALTGLQFVVIALIADSRTRSSGSSEIAAFGTPTVLHFCAALLVAALVSTPWPALGGLALALGACGLAGVVYATIVLRRARRQQGYRLVLEDWIWHTALPLLAYAAILAAAGALLRYAEAALFVVAAATLLLVYIGIHNAWDAVTYVAIDLRQQQDGPGRSQAPPR